MEAASSKYSAELFRIFLKSGCDANAQNHDGVTALMALMWALLPATGRYRHAPDAVARELVDAGFTGVVREPLVMRHETGQPVAGEILLARATG